MTELRFASRPKPSAGFFFTHQEPASQPSRLRLSLAVHRDYDTGLRLGVRRDRRAPASVRQVLPQLRAREEGRGQGWSRAGPGPRAAGGNEARRTFVLCCASSWFTSTRRLNVVCFGAGCVAGEGSGARGRACHGVSRMAHALQSGEIHAAGSRGRGENEDRSTQRAPDYVKEERGVQTRGVFRGPHASEVARDDGEGVRQAHARGRASRCALCAGAPPCGGNREETFSKLFRSRTPTLE